MGISFYILLYGERTLIVNFCHLAFGFASSALSDKTGNIDVNKKPVAVVVGVSEETLTFSSLTALLSNIQSE